MRGNIKQLEKDMEARRSMVTSNEIIPRPNTTIGGPWMEGYLFKRTSNAFKSWNRRWFYLYDNQLVYRKRSGDEQVTVMEEDLRLCSVKPVTDGERRFCFEVLSPSKSHMLQADSAEMYDLWITSMQKGIGAAIQRINSHNDHGVDDRARNNRSSSMSSGKRCSITGEANNQLDNRKKKPK